MSTGMILFGLAAGLAAIAFATTASASDVGGNDVNLEGGSGGRQAVVQAGRAAGLDDVWISWLLWVAKGESNFSLKAHNDRDGEVRASAVTYKRMIDNKSFPCPPQTLNVPPKTDPNTGDKIVMKPQPPFVIGSGGWFGQLAPLTVDKTRDLGAPSSVVCNPAAVWRDPTASTAAHLQQVRGTINGYLNKLPENKRTFLHLRALYGNPSRINSPNAIDNPERRAAYGKTLTNAGLSPAFLDQKVPPLSFRNPWT